MLARGLVARHGRLPLRVLPPCRRLLWREFHHTPRAARDNSAAAPSTDSNVLPNRAWTAPSYIPPPDDADLRTIFDAPPPRPTSLLGAAWSAATSSPGKNVGLLRNKYLTSADGFRTFAAVTLRRAERIRLRALAARTEDDYAGLVRLYDRLSDVLCRVLDTCDFVRNTHPDSAIQRAASDAWTRVFQYMNELNTTTELSDQLDKALNDPRITARWSREERAVAEMLQLDFHKSAVHQPVHQRARFVELSQRIVEVGSEFLDRAAPETPVLRLPSSKLRGLDPMVAARRTMGGMIALPTVGPEAILATRTVQDPETRRTIYNATRTASKRTLGLLRELVGHRAELAALSGFESYGHMTLQSRMMAKTPEAAREFLVELSKQNSVGVAKELSLLSELKNRDIGRAEPLQAWDREYYMEKLRRQLRSRLKQDYELAAYFSLGTVMQGVSRLLNRLYGIRLVPTETLPGETWHPDVKRLDVVSDEEGHIAVLYCDLFHRPDKSPNPAHFTLRCSRAIPADEIREVAEERHDDLSLPSFASADEAANDGMASSRSSHELKQLPTIALICDFEQYHHQQGGGRSGAPGGQAPRLLTLHQVETLFHEMGHAAHSFLARTSLQNVAGTRCATDLAELPSQLLECFVADPASLALFARHWRTDEPLPYGLVADKVKASRQFAGLDTEFQIILALFDQECHSDAVARRDGGWDSTRAYHGLQRKFGLAPADPPGTGWQGFFGHLFGYGSTYYSYLFDRVLAERVWKVVFDSGQDGGAVNRENGERLKESLLRWGGGRDPWECLADALGDEKLARGDREAMATVGGWGIGRSRGEGGS